LYLLILSFLSPSGQFGLMSDNFNCRYEIFKIHPFLWNFLFRFVDKITIIMIMLLWNIVFLKHLHHFCISDDQGFSFLVHNTIKLCQEEDFNILNINWVKCNNLDFKEEHKAWKSWTCSTNFEKCYYIVCFRQNKDWQITRYWQF
jgi:hypothetical protein